MPVIRKGPKVAKIKPFGENVVVAPTLPKDKTPGGILIPDDAKRPTLHGKIVEIGPGVPEEYRIGDTVLFSQYAGLELDLEDVEGCGDNLKILVIPYKQIIAKVALTD